MSHGGPNVLVVMSDQHNFRFLGQTTSGPELVRTPTLDELFGKSTVFEQAYCAKPICTASRLCLLTGRRAPNAGAWENESLLKPGLSTIADNFTDAGYATALVGKMHLGGDRQFAGFQSRPYGDLTGKTGHQMDPLDVDMIRDARKRTTVTGVSQIPESLLQEQKTVQETVSYIRERALADPGTPWFVLTSLSQPHWPRTAPKRFIDRYDPGTVPPPTVSGEAALDHPFLKYVRDYSDLDGISEAQVQESRASYAACVEYLDEIVGDLLSLLDRDGLLDDTIVVYLSDHGELAGEHGLWDKYTWHEDSARVPLSIQLPGHRTGDIPANRASTPVSLIDLYPTLCELAGVPVSADADGVSLAPAVEAADAPDRGPIVCDFLRGGGGGGLDYRMVRSDGYKYVAFRDAPELLFDLEADPGERKNLVGDPAAAEELERLRGFVEESIDFDAVARRRAEDRRLKEEHRLGIAKGTGNAYHMPDGRVIDADTPLYHPHELVADPEVVFDDYPPADRRP